MNECVNINKVSHAAHAAHAAHDKDGRVNRDMLTVSIAKTIETVET